MLNGLGESEFFWFNQDEAKQATTLIFERLITVPMIKDPEPVSKSSNTVTFAYKGEDSSEAVITFASDNSEIVIGSLLSCKYILSILAKFNFSGKITSVTQGSCFVMAPASNGKKAGTIIIETVNCSTSANTEDYQLKSLVRGC